MKFIPCEKGERRRLDGLNMVIVGAAGGIGAAISRCAAAEGASLFLLDKNAAGLESLTRTLSQTQKLSQSQPLSEAGATGSAGQPGKRAGKAGPLLAFRQVDITDENQVREAAAAAADHFAGRVDVLVNTAGISGRPLGDGPVHVVPAATWAEVLAVNLTGVYYTCKHFVPLLMNSPAASIINIASDDALIGPRPPHDTHAYIASKGGVIALTRAMAVSYAPRIRVNAVAPGWVATPMTGDLRQDPEAWQEVVQRHPLGKVGHPEDVAWAVIYLASRESAFVTGIVLPVEGGATAW